MGVTPPRGTSAAVAVPGRGGDDSRPGRAALWMAGAVGSFSLMAVGGRELAGRLDTFEIMFYRSALGFAAVVLVGWWAGRLREARTTRPGLHGVRNVFHFTGQNLWFFAVGAIPLAQVFALEFTTPIWVAVLAPLVLGETMTRARLAAALLGFAGILLVARPGLTPVEVGHGAAALAAVCFAGTFLATKRLARTDSTWTILFWMTLMQTAMGAATAGIDGDVALPRGDAAVWTLVVGLCGLSAHFCVTSALHCAPASVVAPMDFARLPIIALVAMALYHEPLEAAVLGGGVLILAGNLINIRAERRRR